MKNEDRDYHNERWIQELKCLPVEVKGGQVGTERLDLRIRGGEQSR